jgi:phage/plasmid-like protein (TIGR03299 family)
MAHEIDQTTGKDAIAYVGETPWHGLGQKLLPGMGMDTWLKEAGLAYEVLRSPVCYTSNNGNDMRSFESRNVLYRSDTEAPLSVVSKGYKIVQPREILDFFGELSNIGGFDLEVAGALSGGKRVWGLAKVGDGAPVIGHDVVRPYVLFATSYDGTMATVAKFTAIRVVCNNTITMAIGKGANSDGKTEVDTENRAVSTMVRIPHSREINTKEIRQQLGIVADVYERWMVNTKLLAEQPMNASEAEKFVFSLIDSITPTPSAVHKLPDVRSSKAYCRILELFNGTLMGKDLAGADNKWVMLNAVSEFVDHERGNSADTRLTGAWFGVGDGIKTKAYNTLTSA